MTEQQTIRVAVTQAEPEYLNLNKGVDKACHLIKNAAENGASLVTFPECFIPGYLAWIWSRPVDMELTTKYIKNSLVVDSPQMELIKKTAAENNITVVLGFSENDNNSLYISQCLIDEAGNIKMLRRKIKATHMERTIFGDSTGDSLDDVVDTRMGRVGALACWEHTQPLLKYHTLLQKEEIHVAAWPPLQCADENGPKFWSMSREGGRNLSWTYAIEAQAFVLHTTAIISPKSIDCMGTSAGLDFNIPGGGSSAIFGPDGRQLSKDLDEHTEGIIYADIEKDAILRAKSFLDLTGHYSRPDLLWLGVDKRVKKHCRNHENI